MMRLFLLLVCPFYLLAGCAAMEEQAREQACNREYGFEQGTNDAIEGKPMDSNFAAICEPSMRREVKQAYREGYEGERNKNQLEADEDGVRIKIPGVDIRMGNKGKKSWGCELNIFGKSYRGFGTSRAQASSDTRRLCEAEHNAVHCNHGIECREER